MLNLGYEFNNKSLLDQALTHPSYICRGEYSKSYERLEFLGDSVLNCVMAEKLYREYSHFSEGELSVSLANIVNAKSIVKVAHELNIADYIEMALGEENSGGRKNPNNLENALEAVIGAIFLDSNYDIVKKILYKWWQSIFLDLDLLSKKDNKSILQELAQKQFKSLPKYKVEEMAGAAHKPVFTVSVQIFKFIITGIGKTRKEAEQNAAAKMLKKIQDEKIC